MQVTDSPAGGHYKNMTAYEQQNYQETHSHERQKLRGSSTSDSRGAARKGSATLPKKPRPLQRKKLNYNSREIRGFLARAVRSQTAGLVLNTAKSKLVSLLKCKGTGMYDENELNTAIIHARRMVRCAQLKLKNLTKEEQQKKRNEKTAETEAADPSIQQVQKALRIKQRRLALEQKRRMHRNLEQAKMNRADEEYRSRQARDQSRPGTASFSPGRDLSDLKLRELELMISREGALLAMESAGEAASYSGAEPGADALPAPSQTAPSPDLSTAPAVADSVGGAVDIGL